VKLIIIIFLTYLKYNLTQKVKINENIHNNIKKIKFVIVIFNFIKNENFLKSFIISKIFFSIFKIKSNKKLDKILFIKILLMIQVKCVEAYFTKIFK